MQFANLLRVDTLDTLEDFGPILLLGVLIKRDELFQGQKKSLHLN